MVELNSNLVESGQLKSILKALKSAFETLNEQDNDSEITGKDKQLSLILLEHKSVFQLQVVNSKLRVVETVLSQSKLP